MHYNMYVVCVCNWGGVGWCEGIFLGGVENWEGKLGLGNSQRKNHCFLE